MRRLLLAAVLLLAVVGLGSVFTAANSMPASSPLDASGRAVGVNDVKPSACAGITLDGRTPGPGNALVYGSGTVTGGNGDDCVVGSPGDDSIKGGGGNDVCIGGGGTDTFASCETTYP